MRKFLIFALITISCSSAHAGPFGRGRNKNYSNANNYSTANNVVSNNEAVTEYAVSKPSSNFGDGSDQERCQAEANYMASRGIKGHVWGVIGRFEGVGWGGSPSCNTCTPSGGMNLTGDASARGSDGWYRVRSWR